MTTPDQRYLEIDQDFPVAGQDNESQGFRDNFTAIKDFLTYTKGELDSLTENTVKLGVKNQFTQDASIETVKLVGTSEATIRSGQAIVLPSGQEVNHSAGSYHSLVLSVSTTLDITGFPAPADNEDGRFAKLRVDAVLSSFSTTTAGSFVTGSTYTITTVGTTDFTAIGAISNTVGVTFVATGAGSGTGEAKQARTLSFVNNAAGGSIKYQGNWPATLFVTSEVNPVVVEFWSYDGGTTIYAQYLGTYGETNRIDRLESISVNGSAILGDAPTDKITFKGIPKLPSIDGVTLSGITGETGMMVFNSTTKRIQVYVPDTGLAQGNLASNIAGWINLN